MTEEINNINKMKWVKIPLSEANQIQTLQDDMNLEGLNLNIDPNKDIREYLNYIVIDGFSYVVLGFFDLENKNRMNPPSDLEYERWVAYAESKNWELVDKLPEQDIGL